MADEGITQPALPYIAMGGLFIMKIKAVLRAMLFAYTVTGLLLLLLAFLLFRFNLGEMPMEAGIVFTYLLSGFLGGFTAGRMIRQNKYLWGLAVGFGYFLLLLLASFLVQGKWELSPGHVLTVFLLCVGGSMAGGMIS